VARLCCITGDDDRRTTISCEEALLDLGDRSRERLRLDAIRHTREPVRTRGSVEAVVELLVGCRARDLGVDDDRRLLGGLQHRATRRIPKACHRQLDADPAPAIGTLRKHAADQPLRHAADEPR